MSAPPNNLYIVTGHRIRDGSPRRIAVYVEERKKDAEYLVDALTLMDPSDNYWVEVIAFNPDPEDILVSEKAYLKKVRS